MDFRRTIVITGGNRGIGLEILKFICTSLKDEKDTAIIFTSTSLKKAEDTLSTLKLHAEMVFPLELDISKAESRTNFRKIFFDKFKSCDTLINNAGFAFKRTTTEPFKTQAVISCGVNYFGTKELTKLLNPTNVVFVASKMGNMTLDQMSDDLRSRMLSETLDEEGLDQIVNEFIFRADKDQQLEGWSRSAYGFSKAALISLCHIYAREAKEQEKKGNSVKTYVACCPGWCRTDMAGQEAPLSAEYGGQFVARLALSLKPEDNGKFFQNQ